MKANWMTFKKKYWDSRSAQEQKILKLFGWGLMPFLLYVVLWQPSHDAVKKLSVSVPVMHMQAERLLNQAAEVEILRHRPQPAVIDAVALKSAIEESASRQGLRDAISAIDLQQPNAVRISFTSVSFERWLHWLRVLQQEQHIRADSLSISSMPQPGMVKINVTLINGRNK